MGIKIIVLYNATMVDKTKCPESVRNRGTHAKMVYYDDGKYYWDYQSVKKHLKFRKNRKTNYMNVNRKIKKVKNIFI